MGRNVTQKISTNRTKPRSKISINQKLQILRDLDSGSKISKIASSYRISRSTVMNIRKRRGKIIECAKNVSRQVVDRTIRVRNLAIHKLETVLFTWIIDQRERRALLSEHLVRQKAKSLFTTLDIFRATKQKFLASHGWFQNFRRRHNLRNVKFRGEAASADNESATAYTSKFKDIIREGEYSSKQVFNVDETGLFWKKMPTRTYVLEEDSQQSGFKLMKDRLTLLLGGNANGDVKLKPLLIFKSATPRPLKNINKESLPVIWRSNRKAWVTKDIFSEWFSSYFVPFVKKYT